MSEEIKKLEGKMAILKEVLLSFTAEETAELEDNIKQVEQRNYAHDVMGDVLSGFSDERNEAYKETVPFWEMIVSWNKKLKKL